MKILALFFTLMSLGAMQETFRIATSSASDIANNRTTLLLMSCIMTGLIVFLAIKFWKKSFKNNLMK